MGVDPGHSFQPSSQNHFFFLRFMVGFGGKGSYETTTKGKYGEPKPALMKELSKGPFPQRRGGKGSCEAGLFGFPFFLFLRSLPPGFPSFHLPPDTLSRSAEWPRPRLGLRAVPSSGAAAASTAEAGGFAAAAAAALGRRPKATQELVTACRGRTSFFHLQAVQKACEVV